MDQPPPSVAPVAGLSDEAFTLAFLQEREAQCPACGYNVHALVTARCPECGLGLRVQVVTTDRVPAAWIVVMVTAAVGAGVGLLVAGVVLREGWPSRGDPKSDILNIVLPFFLAMIPAPLVALGLRSRFGRWNRLLVSAVAALLTAAIFLMLALFLFAIAH
jgi:hypothetical protein